MVRVILCALLFTSLAASSAFARGGAACVGGACAKLKYSQNQEQVQQDVGQYVDYADQQVQQGQEAPSVAQWAQETGVAQQSQVVVQEQVNELSQQSQQAAQMSDYELLKQQNQAAQQQQNQAAQQQQQQQQQQQIGKDDVADDEDDADSDKGLKGFGKGEGKLGKGERKGLK